MSPEEIDVLIKDLDSDNSGKVDAKELLKCMADCGLDMETCQAFITEHDKDGDGSLNRAELIEFLKSM